MIVGFCWILLFLFVPETFWDRTPRPKDRSRQASKLTSRLSIFSHTKHSRALPQSGLANQVDGNADDGNVIRIATSNSTTGWHPRRPSLAHRTSGAPTRNLHVGFAPGDDGVEEGTSPDTHKNSPVNDSLGTEIDPISESGMSPIGKSNT